MSTTSSSNKTLSMTIHLRLRGRIHSIILLQKNQWGLRRRLGNLCRRKSSHILWKRTILGQCQLRGIIGSQLLLREFHKPRDQCLQTCLLVREWQRFNSQDFRLKEVLVQNNLGPSSNKKIIITRFLMRWRINDLLWTLESNQARCSSKLPQTNSSRLKTNSRLNRNQANPLYRRRCRSSTSNQKFSNSWTTSTSKVRSKSPHRQKNQSYFLCCSRSKWCNLRSKPSNRPLTP